MTDGMSAGKARYGSSEGLNLGDISRIWSAVGAILMLLTV